MGLWVKALLSNYKLVIGYVVGGIVITATVIVAVEHKSFFTNSFFEKPAPTAQTETQSVPPAQTPEAKPVNPLAQFDGNYSGTSGANAGITAVKVNIASGKISGSASYAGGADVTVELTVSGTVDASGGVGGSLSGSGAAGEEGAAVGGTYTGQITGNTIDVDYSGSGGGVGAGGSIVLTKI